MNHKESLCLRLKSKVIQWWNKDKNKYSWDELYNAVPIQTQQQISDNLVDHSMNIGLV